MVVATDPEVIPLRPWCLPSRGSVSSPRKMLLLLRGYRAEQLRRDHDVPVTSLKLHIAAADVLWFMCHVSVSTRHRQVFRLGQKHEFLKG